MTKVGHWETGKASAAAGVKLQKARVRRTAQDITPVCDILKRGRYYSWKNGCDDIVLSQPFCVARQIIKIIHFQWEMVKIDERATDVSTGVNLNEKGC